MAIGDDGEFGYRPFNDALVAALHDQARDGLLHREELLRMAFPVVARTEKELRAPFSPKGRFAGLTIEHLEVFNAEDRFWARFQLDGDAKAFGAQWAAFARAALFPTLVTALNGGVNDPRAIKFLQQLEVAVAQRLSNTPEPMQIPLASFVLVKS
jgi:hypothetical protein